MRDYTVDNITEAVVKEYAGKTSGPTYAAHHHQPHHAYARLCEGR